MLGHFEQQTTAITCLAVGSNATPMSHTGKLFNSGFQQFMAGLPLHMGNQAEATVVAKLAGLMKTSVHGRASKNVFYLQRRHGKKEGFLSYWFAIPGVPGL